VCLQFAPIPIAFGRCFLNLLSNLVKFTKLSPRTFWNFAREFSSFRRQGAAAGERRWSDPGHGSVRLLVRPRGPLLPGSRLQTHEPAGLAGRKAVSCQWSCGRVDWGARPAGRRSVGLNAGPACGGRAWRQVCWNRVPGAEVHLVWRLSAKRRMWKHLVVFLDVELD